MDATPSIKDKKEESNFHLSLRKLCDRHNKTYYKKYKEWCDRYFLSTT